MSDEARSDEALFIWHITYDLSSTYTQYTHLNFHLRKIKNILKFFIIISVGSKPVESGINLENH